jgi:hypothetical protein
MPALTGAGAAPFSPNSRIVANRVLASAASYNSFRRMARSLAAAPVECVSDFLDEGNIEYENPSHV